MMKDSVCKYLQFGCGFSAPENWLNFDASPTLKLEKIPIIGNFINKNENKFPINVKYGNIVNGLPVPKNFFKGIYASHILEHLSLNDFRIALNNTYEILAPNGIFRIVVPDLELLVKEYLSSGDSYAFMRNSYLGIESRSKGFVSFLINWLGSSHHLWMWDFKSLTKELKNAGFKEIRRSLFNDCEDEMFKFVEDEGRFFNALAIQCKK